MYETEVQRGSALLDRERPGWDQRINPSTLDVASDVACPLGQEFGDFILGLIELHLSWKEAADHGFTARQLPVSLGSFEADQEHYKRIYADLNTTWKALVRERQSATVTV